MQEGKRSRKKNKEREIKEGQFCYSAKAQPGVREGD
jgi:hypothetical protein